MLVIPFAVQSIISVHNCPTVRATFVTFASDPSLLNATNSICTFPSNFLAPALRMIIHQALAVPRVVLYFHDICMDLLGNPRLYVPSKLLFDQAQ
jgi:hypothetical protein